MITTFTLLVVGVLIFAIVVCKFSVPDDTPSNPEDGWDYDLKEDKND